MLMLPPTALPTSLRVLVDPPPAVPVHDVTSTRLRSIAARLLRRRAPAGEVAPDEPAHAVSCG